MDRQKDKDAVTNNFLLPDRKRTKITCPDISFSDKGKSKVPMFSVVHGSSSAGVMRSTKNDNFDAVPRKYSNNVVDLTTPHVIQISGDRFTQEVTKVYSRRRQKGPTLNTRTTPASFHDALLKLNNAQISAGREIGFGRILELKVKDLPLRLAYWVHNKFNADTCELEVDARRRFAVTPVDVYRVFGFPSGDKSIEIFERQSNSDLFEQWVSIFGVDSRDKIKIGVVIKEMLDCKCGGSWFKRHFMIAMSFSLFESYANGTVHPFILGCLADLRDLTRWNWA
ncbi:uncharacterized protein LOC131016401 [Salvia miltiorrhiza]|uniref:uncharacterized protein LOC131016401 n=1 Tax=Salvia miltiorrhiza TaxID=226208 RepID=UPI0025AC3894|nr:uncharacterized protein LOC131016401 [Salvia miltiorrhiza]XP_057801083.1 uncharacterized protein LOC131016401 [Salvia miltiorrhiza]